MATRQYLDRTNGNTPGYSGASLSVALTAPFASGGVLADLIDAPIGSTPVSGQVTGNASTAAQKLYLGKWLSKPLTGTAVIQANTWTLGYSARQAAITGNWFIAWSIYVVKADGTRRGIIWDSPTSTGPELTNSSPAPAHIGTVSGAAVSGIIGTDRLAVEAWFVTAGQDNATARVQRLSYAGNNPISEGSVDVAGNPVAYIETPQSGLFDTAPPPPLDSTTLYFRASQDNVDTHTTAEFSAMTPLDRLTQCHDLQLQPNPTPTPDATPSQSIVGSANTVPFQTYLGKFLSPVLGVSTIPAGEWEVGWSLFEEAAAANRYLALSVYVLKADDTVRGYVYDDPAHLGPEATTVATGRITTFTGASVTSIVSTDRLVVEVWTTTPGQALANTYRQSFFYDGGITIVDGTTNADPKSYITAPVGGLVSTVTPYGPTATITPTGIVTISAAQPISLGGGFTPGGALTLTTSPTLSTGELEGSIEPTGRLVITKTGVVDPGTGQGGSGCRQPYLRLCGVEIMNAARTVEYIRRVGGPRFELSASVHPVLYHTQGEEEQFVTPSTDPAPWYDPAIPASAEFLGFLGEITEVSTPTARQVTAVARGGAQLGGYRLGPRTLTVKGFVTATTWQGQQYGREWLANALSSCLGCGLCDTQVYLYAPTLDRLDTTDGRYTLYESALTDGPKETAKPSSPEVAALEFTITSEHGEWFEPALLQAPIQDIPEPSFPPGCIAFDEWLCEQPLGSVAAFVNPPRVGSLGVIVSIDATDGEANGIEIAFYPDCAPGTGDTAARRIVVGNVPLGGYLTVDSARRRVTYIAPDGRVYDGVGFLQPDEETDIEWMEMNFCDQPGCVVVRKQANCSLTTNVGVAIMTQLRVR